MSKIILEPKGEPVKRPDPESADMKAMAFDVERFNRTMEAAQKALGDAGFIAQPGSPSFDNCPVCDKTLSQGEYDLQTCGTHFVAGKIRNHRKMYPALAGERNIYESAPDPKQGLNVRGVGRVADEPRALLVLLNERAARLATCAVTGGGRVTLSR